MEMSTHPEERTMSIDYAADPVAVTVTPDGDEHFLHDDTSSPGDYGYAVARPDGERWTVVLWATNEPDESALEDGDVVLSAWDPMDGEWGIK